MSGLFVSQPPFLFQTWSETKTADRPGELLRQLTRSCFLLLPLGRLSLLSPSLLLGTPHLSRWILSFPLHAFALISLFLAKMRLSLTLTLFPSRSGTLDRRLCSFSFWQRRLWCTCQLLSLWHWGHYFLLSKPSMLKFLCWSLRHSANSLLISAAPTRLPLLFSSYLTLSQSSPPWLLLHLFFYLNLSEISGRNFLLSLSVLSGYNRSLDTRFFWGTTRLMSWPDEER